MNIEGLNLARNMQHQLAKDLFYYLYEMDIKEVVKDGE